MGKFGLVNRTNKMRRNPVTNLWGKSHRAMQTGRFILALLAAGLATSSSAQDLAPRAYLVTPVHSNAITLTWSCYSGGLELNNVVPISNATGTYTVPVFSLYHSLNFFGRSANITGSLPYAVGTFSGDVGEAGRRSIYRSGLADLSFRLSVNLLGGPAMQVPQFVKWKQKKILGASLKVVAPTGQYDPHKLINWGINKWAFKPEVGYSQRFAQNWVVDAYGGVWFYTTNPQFYNPPLSAPQTQAPVGSLEGHLSYDFKRLLWSSKLHGWVSLDGNYWWGGIASIYGIPNPKTAQTSSRLGGTLSVPYSRHQSIKVALSAGTYSRFGGDYTNLQVAWQYSWLGRPN
jgi:hypothetical protein